MRIGGVVSLTVTFIDPNAELPESSVAVKVTVVSPSGNAAGALLVTTGSASQISVAVGVPSVTTVPSLLVCSIITSAGMDPSNGEVVSCTVITTVDGLLVRLSAVTLRVTTVLPSGNVAIGSTPEADPPDQVQW
jgi:hypothetical protein